MSELGVWWRMSRGQALSLSVSHLQDGREESGGDLSYLPLSSHHQTGKPECDRKRSCFSVALLLGVKEEKHNCVIQLVLPYKNCRFGGSVNLGSTTLIIY